MIESGKYFTQHGKSSLSWYKCLGNVMFRDLSPQ